MCTCVRVLMFTLKCGDEVTELQQISNDGERRERKHEPCLFSVTCDRAHVCHCSQSKDSHTHAHIHNQHDDMHTQDISALSSLSCAFFSFSL